MRKFSLTLSPSATRDLDQLDDKIVKQIFGKLPALKDNPFPHGKLVKKIKGKRAVFYRLRVGKYRVFYYIDGRNVAVLRVIGKKDAGKFIKTMER